MTKVKEKLYEHRFGMGFFVMLLIYSLFDFKNFYCQPNTGLTYSIYCVDFSLGFCTRLLPGSVFRLLCGEATPEKASAYINILLLCCLASAAFFSSKLLNKFNSEEKKAGLIITVFTLIIFFSCLNSGRLVFLLDFYWIIGAVLFLFFLSNRYMYFFVPLAFIYTLLSHYGSMICYIPMFIIILFIKIINSPKKEKKMLSIILVVSTVVVVGLFIYMLMFELENFNQTYEEFHAFFISKGVTNFEYYEFPFFRESTGLSEFTDYVEIKDLIEIDLTQSKIIVLLETVINQIQVHLVLWDHGKFIHYLVAFIPLYIFICVVLFKYISDNSISVLKKILIVVSMLLPMVSVILSLFMSTDTLRWICHSVIELIVLFAYFVYNEKKIREKCLSYISKISVEFFLFYLVLCTNYANVV